MAGGGDTSGLLSLIKMLRWKMDERIRSLFCKCLDLVFVWRINYTIKNLQLKIKQKCTCEKRAQRARARAHKQNMLLTQIQWSGARTTTTVSDRRCLVGAKVLINSGERRTTMCTIGVIGLRHLCSVHNRRRRRHRQECGFCPIHSIGRARHCSQREQQQMCTRKYGKYLSVFMNIEQYPLDTRAISKHKATAFFLLFLHSHISR